MRHRIYFNYFFLAMLIGLAGCHAPYERSTRESWEFSVDDERWILELKVYPDKNGKTVSPSLMVYPGISIVEGTKTTTSSTFYQPFRDSITAEINTLYFFGKDGEEAIEKTFCELGIDSSRLPTDQAICDYLHPVLEVLIREHVKKLDME